MNWPRPEDVAKALGGATGSGNRWTARCPAHDDKTPSLSIAARTDGGALLVHCFAGCSQEEVVDALKRQGLWAATSHNQVSRSNSADAARDWAIVLPVPTDLPPPDFAKFCGTQPATIHRYEDSTGALLGYQCRIDQDDGKKRFLPLTYWRDAQGAGQWRTAGFPKPRPLYGIKQLADRPSCPVLVVEGEKAVDAARTLLPDHVVITWPNGANAVSDADWAPLIGRDLTIWPDNDGPGIKAARDAAIAAEASGARRVRIVTLPQSLPEKWDLGDQIPEGVHVLDLIAQARPFDETLARLVLSARELRNLNLPERQYIIDRVLPAGGLGMLYSRRGVGKTWVGLTAGLSVARGEAFLCYSVPKARTVLYVDGEMSLIELRDRLRQLDGPETDDLLFLASEHLAREGESININNRDDQSRIDQMLERLERNGTRPELIILDNLSSLGGGIDENDNSALDGQLRWLTSLRHRGYAVLVIHHAGKSGDQRGASRREDILDTTIKLEEPKDDEMTAGKEGATFDLEFTKTRGLAPEPSKLRLSLRPNEAGTLEWQYSKSVTVKPHYNTLRRIHLGVPLPGGSIRPYRSQQELTEGYFTKGAVSKHIAKLTAELLVVIERDRICITEKGAALSSELFGGPPIGKVKHIVKGPDERLFP